jgi:hypothetical protein
MKIGGYIAFGFQCDGFNPDGAEIALRRAGFDVIRMPEKFRRTAARSRSCSSAYPACNK